MKNNDKQERIAEAEKFFNLLFGGVHEKKFGYLWTKKNNRTRTYPFDVSNPDERRKMARKAITLNDGGADVYYGINLSDTPPDEKHRAKHETVTLQTAVIADVDIRNERAHKGDPNNYPPTFDVAKMFLPFDASVLINSGYGLHGLCLYAEPIAITDDNRADCEARNKNFIEVIRHNAGVFGKAVDSVGDLPRVLRCPGTRNYKLGVNNDAPICHVVEVNDIRFTPDDMDAKLTAATPTRQEQQKSSTTDTKQESGLKLIYSSVTDSQEYDQWRARRMLEIIPVAELTHDDWLHVGMALKNNGNACSDWELWSRPDERFKDGECEKRWATCNRDGLTIGTIHDIAKKYGYDEKSARREWYEIHPELATKKTFRPAPMDDDEDDEPDENFTWTQERIKSCPVNLRLPHNYEWNRFGITKILPPKKETDPPKKICVARTPLLPTKIFREPTKNKFSYEIAILFRGTWHTTEIDGKTLTDPRTIGALGEDGALILEPKILCHFLNDIISLNPGLKEIKAYGKTGWHDEKFIYPTGGTDYIVRRAGFDYKKIFTPQGDPDAWKKKFAEVAEFGGATACVCLGVVLSAPLAESMIGANPSAHLFGKSGGGKTALQKFCASIFGSPRELIRTFAATNKNRLLVADAFNGLPTFFDELETVQGKAAEEALSNDVYRFYDGTGNEANKRDGSAREVFKFRASRLTTGERPILKQNDLRGAFKRLLSFNCGLTLFPDEFAADLHFFAEANFGHFGKVWIDFVTEHLADIKKQYEFFAKFYAPKKKYEPTHLKMLAAATVAFEFFSVALGLKDEFDKISCSRNMRAIVDNLPTTDELDDTARAIRDLSSYVAAHEKSFIRDTEDEDGKPGEITSWGVTTHGKIFDNGEVVFFPTELKKILEDELHFASADKLISEWNAQEYLITATGRTTHLVRIGKKTYRTIHFKAGVISKDSDSAELDYYTELGVLDD